MQSNSENILIENKNIEDSLIDYSYLFQHSPNSYIVLNMEGFIIDANYSVKTLLGKENDSIVRRRFAGLIHKDDIELFEMTFSYLKDHSNSVSFKVRLIKYDGSIIWVNCDFHLKLANSNGNHQILVLIKSIKTPTELDFNQINKTEKNVASKDGYFALEYNYKKLYESMMDGFVFVDMEGHILEFNQVYVDMLGYDVDEIYPLTYNDITPSKWHEFENEIVLNEIIPNGFSRLYEKEYKRKDGVIIPVELRTSLVKNEHDESIGMWAIVRDISERKASEEIIKKNEKQYRLLVENQTDFIVEVGISGQFVYVSPTFCKLIGNSENEIIDNNFKALLVVEDQDVIVENLKEVLKPPYTCSFEVRMKTTLGGRWVSWSIKALLDENDMPISFIGIGRDISERKRIEEDLRQSEVLRVKTIERLRISTELHDHIGHLVVSNKMRIERCLIMNKTPENTYELKNTLEHHIALMKEIRQYSSDLSNVSSYRMNLEKDINLLLNELEEVHGIMVTKKIDNVFNLIHFEKCETIYRILEEACTNILKHSKSTLILFRIYEKAGNIYFVIRNYGEKIIREDEKRGRGLKLMEQKASLIGGEIEFCSDKERYFEVRLHMKLF